MFVDLMSDVAETFTDRFLKVQLVIEEGPPPSDGRGESEDGAPVRPAPTRRYNALGVLEDIPSDGGAVGTEEVMDVGPAETPAPAEERAAVKRDPMIVGAGRARSLSDATSGAVPQAVDWSSVGRNDPCPCGSGKKFKKCHGASL